MKSPGKHQYSNQTVLLRCEILDIHPYPIQSSLTWSRMTNRLIFLLEFSKIKTVSKKEIKISQ